MAATGPALIASGSTTSAAVDLGVSAPDGGLVGIVMPATFTGASITFQVSADDTTYQALNNASNSAISLTVTQAKSYGFTADIRSALVGWRWIKIVSASSEGGNRSIGLIVK